MRRALLVVVASSLLAACGSTAQVRGSLTTNGLQQGSGDLGTTGSAQQTGPAGPAGSGVPGGAGAANGTRTGGSTTTSSQATALPSAATAPVAGTRLAPIEVGILLFPDLNDFAGKFGATADAGNQSLEVDTVVSWINKHGGAAGHQVVVVKHNVSLTSSDTYDQLAEQACQDFTVDHHVVAVIAPGTAVSDNFPKCLQKHGVLYLSSGLWIHDLQDWQQYPNMWSAAEPDARGVGQAMVDQVLHRPLARRGDTVGLMVMEEPGGVRTADSVVKPQLAAAGIKVVEYTVPAPASTADISNAVAVDDSAELKMASQGIKTVLFLCPGCLSFFAQNADSQHYYPTYVASTYDSPAGLTGTTYDSTMRSAVLIGWSGDHDVGLYSHPKELTDNPTRNLCHTIMGPSHQSTGDVSEFATQVVCDGFLEVKYAAELNPANPLTGPALQVGESLFGTQRPCALNFSTRIAPGHHGGVTSYRLMHWDAGTHAFAYDSPTRLPFRLPS